jgi:hypothetical protein
LCSVCWVRRVSSLGFKVKGLGFRVQGLGLKPTASGFRLLSISLGFGIQPWVFSLRHLALRIKPLICRNQDFNTQGWERVVTGFNVQYTVYEMSATHFCIGTQNIKTVMGEP